MKALEDTIAHLQRQVVEAEANSHYGAIQNNDEARQIMLEEITLITQQHKDTKEELEAINNNYENMKKKLELTKGILTNYESTIEKLHREVEYFKLKVAIPHIAPPERTQ